MLKILLRTLIILAAAGLVAGGIYLFAQNGGTSLLSAGAVPDGRSNSAAFASGQISGQPDGGGFTKGEHNEGGMGEGGRGFSLLSLTRLAMALGKVAVITAAVVAMQAVMRLFKRRRRSPGAAAA